MPCWRIPNRPLRAPPRLDLTAGSNRRDPGAATKVLFFALTAYAGGPSNNLDWCLRWQLAPMPKHHRCNGISLGACHVMAKMRIATWNLERPRKNGLVKNERRLDRIRGIDADLWILTETHAAIALAGYSSVASERPDGYREGESYASIWSRWPICQQIPTFDPRFAVCAELASPAGPMVVYGSIITYANDPGPEKISRRWEEHRKSIEAHAIDWRRLRESFPSHLFCAAGDFNQSRDGSGWYEDAQSVVRLTQALEDITMQCVTELDMRANGLSRATVDHICLSRSLVAGVSVLGAWEGHTESGDRMSDHNGVFVDIDTTDPGGCIRSPTELAGHFNFQIS